MIHKSSIFSSVLFIVYDFLTKIGISDSALCSFCKLETETLSHLFFDFNLVNKFWLDAQYNVIKEENFVNLNKDLVFFGDVKNMNSPLNFFILHIKYYIYCCRGIQVKA